MAQIVPPKPNPLMEAMAKLLKEKAPGVVEAAGKVAEYPPVNFAAKLLNAGDPMGMMGMGMAMGPAKINLAIKPAKVPRGRLEHEVSFTSKEAQRAFESEWKKRYKVELKDYSHEFAPGKFLVAGDEADRAANLANELLGVNIK